MIKDGEYELLLDDYESRTCNLLHNLSLLSYHDTLLPLLHPHISAL